MLLRAVTFSSESSPMVEQIFPKKPGVNNKKHVG
jgi:hypothetical protein